MPLDTDTSHPPVPSVPSPTDGSGGAAGAGRVGRSGSGRATAAHAAAQLQRELTELAAREPGATVEFHWQVIDR